MRVWLDGNLLNKYNLTPVDVINELQVQNDQIAAGQLGGTPALKGQQLNASIIARTRLKDPQEEFGKGRCESTLRWLCRPSERRRPRPSWGRESNVVARINGKPVSVWVLSRDRRQRLDIATATKEAGRAAALLSGMKVVYPYDTTPFVKISIHEVVKTLLKQLFSSFLSCICSAEHARNAHSNHCRTRGAVGNLSRYSCLATHQHADLCLAW